MLPSALVEVAARSSGRERRREGPGPARAPSRSRASRLAFTPNSHGSHVQHTLTLVQNSTTQTRSSSCNAPANTAARLPLGLRLVVADPPSLALLPPLLRPRARPRQVQPLMIPPRGRRPHVVVVRSGSAPAAPPMVVQLRRLVGRLRARRVERVVVHGERDVVPLLVAAVVVVARGPAPVRLDVLVVLADGGVALGCARRGRGSARARRAQRESL